MCLGVIVSKTNMTDRGIVPLDSRQITALSVRLLTPLRQAGHSLGPGVGLVPIRTLSAVPYLRWACLVRAVLGLFHTWCIVPSG